MAEQFTEFLKGLFNSDSLMVNILIIFIVSMMPILELRGGIVAAALLGVNLWIAFPVCIIANLIPIPFVLLFIRKIFEWLKKLKKVKPIIEKLENRAKDKGQKFETYKAWGLYTFVGIPLPGTGAWTGALVADILNMKPRKSFPIIVAGVVTAGVIMAIISYGIPALLKLF